MFVILSFRLFYFWHIGEHDGSFSFLTQYMEPAALAENRNKALVYVDEADMVAPFAVD